MAVERVQRKLAAILAADVVGFSRMMGEDEEGTLAVLTAHLTELVRPCIAEHRGRIFKTMGDGVLAEFASVVDAVLCSVAYQKGMAERNREAPEDRRIEFRIGVNLGDVMVQDDDVFGDGVNIAARLEGLAKPGSVVVSGKVHEEVRAKLDIRFEDLGPQKVKNIAEPVRAFSIHMEGGALLSDGPPSSNGIRQSAPLPLPDKPSIAVLPFQNMSDDPGQEFFADGIAEDVITALSRFRSLFVIARNSSFTYKGGDENIAKVAGELGVRYVVEGSVRKAVDRVRITAQLIDATSGNHLWADRFDGSLDDVFDLQDKVTEQIVIAVEPEILISERERAIRKSPESLDSWEFVQQGLSQFYRSGKADYIEAIRLFGEAIALEPDCALAHANLAHVLCLMVVFGYTDDTTSVVASARSAAEQALSVDPNEPLAHLALGRVHIFAGDIEMAIGEMRTAISINPNFAGAYYGLGLVYYFSAGQAEQSLPHLDAALRLSPRDPARWLTMMVKGSALRTLGRYDEAIELCRRACQVPNASFQPHMHLAAALADAGQTGKAQATIEKAIQLQPALSIGFCRRRYIGMNDSALNNLIDSLRKAGLPE